DGPHGAARRGSRCSAARRLRASTSRGGRHENPVRRAAAAVPASHHAGRGRGIRPRPAAVDPAVRL
ncbi:MAG: hypothetical protein AVDCRST_MAG08-4292, partial [uncultured Acetobacteraceae bacterium]